MTPERWRRVGALFQSALDEDPVHRADFLAAACGSDVGLREEVEALLAADREAGAFGASTSLDGFATRPDGAAERSLRPGARLGPYEIIDLIATGGMGEVYRARDGRLGREVAVKVLPAALLADAGRMRRFDEEARAAGALNHPNILAVYDVGREGALPYVVSELLDGETLRARLTREGALSAADAVEVARQVAAGLVAAHDKGILHRDLKPANLFLTRDARVKILDFGLAKRVSWAGEEDRTAATQPGVLLGTAGYMSPEQARGEPTDPRTDIFSFGAVLFEMLAGRRAFEGRTPVDTLAAVLDADPDFAAFPGDVPGGLRDVVRYCLEKDRDQRLGSARALQAALAGGGAVPHAALPARAGRRASVAVLPFLDLSSPPDGTNLGLGLADATITELARLRSLLVRPTSAVLRYVGAAPDPREAGRELAVDTVVEGRFQRAGERVRVTVQLLAVDDGRPLWATKVDTSLSDVFGMQDEVSGRIAQALQVELSPAPALRRAPRPPSAAAYDLYLKGKLALWRESLSDFLTAVDCFEKAREVDPGFALAWAGLADAYVRIAFEAQPEGDWYARAQSMCDRALALDPDLPEARHVRARIMWSPPGGWDHGGAMRELMAALAGRPSLDDAHIRLGVVLWHVGLIDEAERSIGRALALSPGHLIATGHRAACLYHRGEFAAAREVVDGVARENQSYWHQYLAGHSRLRLGDLEGAAGAAERMILTGEEARSHGHGLHALVAARRGDRAGALRAAEAVVASQKSFGHFHHDQYDIACVHALLGSSGEAVHWLRLVAANGYACHPFFAIDPFLESLRGEPAFAAFLDDVRREGARLARRHAGLVDGVT